MCTRSKSGSGAVLDMTPEGVRQRTLDWYRSRTVAALPSSGTHDDVDVAVFHALAPEEERQLILELCEWHQAKWGAAIAGLEWPEEVGGWGRDATLAAVVADVEKDFPLPRPHELFNLTTKLCAPTLWKFGTPEQRRRFVPMFARAEKLCAQLFSEPGAGSDLAGLGTNARRTDDHWTVNGQKVWSSGAQFADWGLLIARTDPNELKHRGMTAFLVPLGDPAVTVRPLRQMSGGASFCEVFFDELVLGDDLRIGDVGDGWRVATTTLEFERTTSGSDTVTGGGWDDVCRLLRGNTVGSGVMTSGTSRSVADLYIRHRLGVVAAHRDRRDRKRPGWNGAVSSLRKLQWSQTLTHTSDVVTTLLGPRLAGDNGTPGTFAWTEHLLGAPGYRIAGGTDEIQRTIIAQRLLGLPVGPRADKGIPWKDIPR